MSVNDHVWKKGDKKIGKRIAERNLAIESMVERTYGILPSDVSLADRRTVSRVLCRESNALHYLEQRNPSKAISLLVEQQSESIQPCVSLASTVAILRSCFGVAEV